MQTVIDEVQSNGGFGSIAHPHSPNKVIYHYAWDWSVEEKEPFGIEIFNGNHYDTFDESDQNAISFLGTPTVLDSWIEFLQSEFDPTNGFVPGTAGSDAHNVGEGGTFLYCHLDSLSTSNIRNAIHDGNCVASNGPLIKFEIYNQKIGETVVYSEPSVNPKLYIEWNSTDQSDPITQIRIYERNHFKQTLLKDVDFNDGYHGTYTWTDSENIYHQNTYYRLEAITQSRKRAFTNPIFIQFSAKIGEKIKGHITNNEYWSNDLKFFSDNDKVEVILDWGDSGNDLDLILDNPSGPDEEELGTEKPKRIELNNPSGTWTLKVHGDSVNDIWEDFTVKINKVTPTYSSGGGSSPSGSSKPSTYPEDIGGVNFTNINLNHISTCDPSKGLQFIIKGEEAEEEHKCIDRVPLRGVHKIDSYREIEVVVFVNNQEKFRKTIKKENLEKK